MLETYTDFMIFKVRDNGEEFRLNTTEETFRRNNGNEILNPLQVVIIIKEALRRIYIWKGVSSSVRKKFIASRVASDLQRKLIDSSNFHRCKIISIDQGDEPEEFLNAFGFKKTQLRIESDITKELEIKTLSSNLNLPIEPVQDKVLNIKKLYLKAKSSPSYQELKENQNSREILERILKNKVPKNLKRTNILIGKNDLYGVFTKRVEVFNNSVEVKEWDLISHYPNQIIELEGQMLRIYLNQAKNEIEAIEILKKNPLIIQNKDEESPVNFNNWTVKQLKQFCKENDIKILSSYRKAEIIKKVSEYHATL